MSGDADERQEPTVVSLMGSRRRDSRRGPEIRPSNTTSRWALILSRSYFRSALLVVAVLTVYQLNAAGRSFSHLDGVTDERASFVAKLPPPALKSPERLGSASRTDRVVSSESAAVNITIVCQVFGELGNNLAHLAHSYGIQSRLASEYKLSSHIVIRNGGQKWRRTQNEIHECFPRLSMLSFDQGNTPELSLRTEQMNQTFDISSIDPEIVEESLRRFVNFSRHNPFRPPEPAISYPFLYAEYLSKLDYVPDRYFDIIEERFVFDHTKCCRLIPDPDETVFHFRNFGTELAARDPTNKGYKELGPKQTARDVLGHLSAGDKVAVVSRFSREEAHEYVDAMEERGLKVRFIHNQTGVQDFCFLMRARKEVVGMGLSTFFHWAAYLSNARRIVVYSLDVPAQWGHFGRVFFHYNFTHPKLANRWTFRLIKPDESPNATLGVTINA